MMEANQGARGQHPQQVFGSRRQGRFVPQNEIFNEQEDFNQNVHPNLTN